MNRKLIKRALDVFECGRTRVLEIVVAASSSNGNTTGSAFRTEDSAFLSDREFDFVLPVQESGLIPAINAVTPQVVDKGVRPWFSFLRPS